VSTVTFCDAAVCYCFHSAGTWQATMLVAVGACNGDSTAWGASSFPNIDGLRKKLSYD